MPATLAHSSESPLHCVRIEDEAPGSHIVSILIADAKDSSRSVMKFLKISKHKFPVIEQTFAQAMEVWTQHHTKSNSSVLQSSASGQQSVTFAQLQKLWDTHKLRINHDKACKNRKSKDDLVPYAICLEDAVNSLKDVKSQDLTLDDKPRVVRDTSP